MLPSDPSSAFWIIENNEPLHGPAPLWLKLICLTAFAVSLVFVASIVWKARR